MVYAVVVKEHTHRVLTSPAEGENGIMTDFIESITQTQTEIETVCDGTVTVEGESIALTYELADRRTVTVSFKLSEPTLITLQREVEGMPRMVLVLETGVRHVCLCKGREAVIEMVSRASSVKNTFLQNGRLAIDYTVEINGIRAERTKTEISLVKNGCA